MREIAEKKENALLETIKKSVAAGMMIGVGATVYLICENKVIGAVLFSIGLFLICSFGLYLFTGKIGYIVHTKNRPNCLLIWLGNLAGCLITSGLVRIAKPELADVAAVMVENKLSKSWIANMILAFFCGVLMYAAVENFRLHKDSVSGITGVFLCVTVFILCGFEHSVADMCYCIFAVASLRQAAACFVFLLAVSACNSLGALALRALTKDHN